MAVRSERGKQSARRDLNRLYKVSVTGSLVSPTLFSRRDANCDCGSSILRDNCDTDWILPLLDHAEGGAMDADGFSIVDNRAGVTFGV